MSSKPFRIFIDGDELISYTAARLSRNKEHMTGTLDITIFMKYVPDEPILINAAAGAEVTAYVGSELAFWGSIDTRRGAGVPAGKTGASPAQTDNSGISRSSSINANEYTVTISCRGRTKNLIDSSHQHPTTNMMRPTNRDVVDKLLEPFDVDVDWKASTIKMDKVRFRDGSYVIDEIRRLCAYGAHFAYETRDGKLRITDDTGRSSGEPLILGENILTFSAEQSEAHTPSDIKVKGQRTDKDVWGEDALLETHKTIKDARVQSYRPITVQIFGDATDEVLERRARFEANKASAKSKTITIEVFHVQPKSGGAWDIGQLHYVSVPCEGIAATFECTGLTYDVQAENVLKTTLTLSPQPASGGGAQGLKAFDTEGLPTTIPNLSYGSGAYPAAWQGPSLSPVVPVAQQLLTGLAALAKKARPNLKLTGHSNDD
jgi:prophage tail gpP-like protein